MQRTCLLTSPDSQLAFWLRIVSTAIAVVVLGPSLWLLFRLVLRGTLDQRYEPLDQRFRPVEAGDGERDELGHREERADGAEDEADHGHGCRVDQEPHGGRLSTREAR